MRMQVDDRSGVAHRASPRARMRSSTMSRNGALLRFAGRGARQRIEQFQKLRQFVGRDLVAEEIRQFGEGHRLARLRDNRGADPLAESRIGDADRRRLQHLRVLIQHLFDLARIDVGTAADDQLLLAVDDLQIAVTVEHADIAGGEPAVGAEAAGIDLGVLVVADRHRGAIGQNLAGRAGRQVTPILIDHADADLRQGFADEPAYGFRIVFRHGVRLEPAFEHAVELQQMAGKLGAHRADHLDRAGGAPRGDHLERG
jgi:hypothetical protein